MLCKFTLHLFFVTKYIVISKFWMGNWRMVLANLNQVVQKQQDIRNRMIIEK